MNKNKNKNIAIITLYGNVNFGNKLQNYAVIKIFERYGFHAETINFYLSKKTEIKRKIYWLKNLFLNRYSAIRYFKFCIFSYRYLNVRNQKYHGDNLPKKINNKYNFFVVGSDQVWNPLFRTNQKKIFFLTFTSKSKRISVSPSIGVDTIPENYISDYKVYLNGFNNLCCREKAGSEEIKRVSGHNCEHLIDPTMVLDSNDWRAFANYSKVPDHKYILFMFLGKHPNGILKKIKQFIGDSKIININDMSSSYFAITPNDYIGLIDRASWVFTDSFHSAAFSINLNTQFYVFDRNDNDDSMNSINSRVLSLLNMFDLTDRYITDVNAISMERKNLNVDDKLRCARQTFSDFINKSIDDNLKADL